jgi:M6 family metalloprotease-like protein
LSLYRPNRKKLLVKSKLSPVLLICTLSIFLASAGSVRGETVVPRFAPRTTGGTRAAEGPRTSGPAETRSAFSPALPVSNTELSVYQKRALERYLSGAAAVDDTLSIIGIQVQFTDSLMGGSGEGGREELHDSTYFANELRHVAEYFRGASRGRLTIRWEVTNKAYGLPEEMGYYGNDELQDVRAVEMMESVIDSADADVDFSLYDTVMLIHAGAGQETDVADNSRVQLWSSFYSRGDIDAAFPDSTVYGLPTNDERDGEPFLVDNFMLVPESSAQDDYTIGSLGVWAFEVASRIGLLPLFDADPPGAADSRGAASYDLMAQGLFNGHVTPDLTLWPGFVPGFPSVFNRVLAGWVDPLLVEENGTYALRDINSPQPGDTACIKIPITESEYYLVVNRVHDTNFDSLFTFGDIDSNFFPENTDSLSGAEFDFFVTVLTDPFEIKPDPSWGGVLKIYFDTGTGMYIWHVDENVIRQMVATGHLPNDFVSQKGVDLEEADGIQDLDGLGDPFSFGSHFDSFRPGNNTVFGPATKPATDANSGAATGITVDEISKTGRLMTCRVSFAPPYEEIRTRWAAGGSYQPPSLVDLDDAGALEIVVFADTANVYAFDADGREFVDRDGDPETIEPYITAPGARWIGAPAFGDIDGDAAAEIVACDEWGSVYAWNGDGTEVVDGDNDPSTTGVLYKGDPIASPPMLFDVNEDGVLETAFVERSAGGVRPFFVNGEGKLNQPSGSEFVIVWGEVVEAQACSPLSYGALGDPSSDTEGVAFVWADTSASRIGFSYMPVRWRGDVGPLAPYRYSWTSTGPVPNAFPAASTIAVGDLDGTGFDEAVFTLPDGRLALYTEAGRSTEPAAPWKIVELRSAHPSAPAIGDVDGNGTFEIALWDDGFSYVFEHNGELRTNWPQRLRPTELGDYPSLVFDERLASPLVLDTDGDGRNEVLFPRGSGGLFGFDSGGNRLGALNRALPDGIEATPSIGYLIPGGDLQLVSLGLTAPLAASDAVFDSLVTGSAVTLAIQTLPGELAVGGGVWLGYQSGLVRQGRCWRMTPPETTGALVETGSFKVYPNPVRGSEVHARVIVNREATVNVEVYNLEGELAASRSARVNPAEVLGTPVDETIGVADLKSGVYMLRLVVESTSGTESFTASFAILR